MKASDLFVIVTLALLGFALVARFFHASSLGITVSWRGTGYVMPPSSIALALSTALCFFATIYSFWMLPFSHTVALWHFWLTTIGIAVFFLALYISGSSLPGSRTALWAVFVTPVLVVLIQGIFVWNAVQAIIKMPRPHS